jgi:hypothetical protein
MDDKNAFERQIAAEIDYEVGPPHPVDALAITRTAKTPTPRWRIRSMFSPAKAITVSALVIGGAFLIAQPFQQESTVPGAATDVVAEPAVIVSGTTTMMTEGDSTSDQPLNGRMQASRGRASVFDWELDDPRLSGSATVTQNVDRWLDESDNDYGIFWGTVSIENEDGSWLGTFVHSDGQTDAYDGELGGVLQLRGSGAYEGWSAILYEYGPNPDAVDTTPRLLNGMMFPGDLPPERE